MIIHKITIRNHIKVLKFHIEGTILMLLVLLFFKFEKFMFIAFSGWWFFITLPVIYLHLKYYLINKGEMLEISNGKIKIYKNGNSNELDVKEIKKILLYRSSSLDKGIPFMPLECYQCIRIIFKSNQEIIITCLMSSDLLEIVNLFEGLITERIKGIYWPPLVQPKNNK